jgi:hypothetical protein
MRRATLAGVILCLISATLAAAELQTTIRKAQELIRDGQFVETITLLERALPDARGDGVLLTLLRQAYRGEIQNRQAAGDAAAVRKYMDRLGLLEDAAARGNDSWKSVEPSVGAGDDNVKVVMPEKDLMPDAATRPKPPTTSTASGWKRATKPILNEELARRAAPTPNNDSSRETNAPSASTARTADLPSVTLRSARAVERKPTTAVAEPDAARKLDATRGLLTQADLLFVAREYAAAEPLYAKANGESSDLPSDAKARWAYCRLAAVVDQMNQQPASFDEWSAIRAELDAILKLAPSNEFALSLLTTAKRHIEQTGPAFAARSNPEAVIRANEPERADAKPSNLLADLAARIGLASSADGSKRPLWQRFRSGKWQVLETSNFRVHYTDENLGGQAADIAEATRIELVAEV